MTAAAATTAPLDALAARLHGPLYRPGSSGYDRATSPRNATARQEPAAAAAVADADDVAQCVRFAAESGTTLAVQATGHGAAGVVGPETLLVDTSGLSSIAVDPAARVARLGAGTVWSDLNAATEAHGLVGLAGTAPDVGVAGYTFHGGVGWLTRPHGLATRLLKAVEYVDGHGAARRADQEHDTEALWAFRGGGGVGIATTLEIELVSSVDLWAGYLLWPVEDADRVIAAWAEAIPRLDPALSTALGLLHLPDSPAVPEHLRGRPGVHLSAASVAGKPAITTLFAALDTVPRPAIDTLGPCNTARLAGIHLDPPARIPARGEGRWLTADTPAHALDILTACGTGPDSPLAEIELRHVGNPVDTATGISGALTTCPGEFLLHAVGAAPDPDATGPVDDAIATLLAATAPVDTGRSAASFRDGRTAAPDALDDSTRARLAAAITGHDPHGRILRARHLT